MKYYWPTCNWYYWLCSLSFLSRFLYWQFFWSFQALTTTAKQIFCNYYFLHRSFFHHDLLSEQQREVFISYKPVFHCILHSLAICFTVLILLLQPEVTLLEWMRKDILLKQIIKLLENLQACCSDGVLAASISRYDYHKGCLCSLILQDLASRGWPLFSPCPFLIRYTKYGSLLVWMDLKVLAGAQVIL
jgi:hypothetical protein